MVRIGVFARLCEVSIKTLRHYDDIGLLVPAYVDDWSGYRYYTLEQLPRLYRILALKDLGFSLDEIAGLLRRNLPPAEMTRLLRGKQAEMQQRLAEEGARLARVETRLRQLEQEGTMSNFDVRLKTVEPQTVASIRETIPDWNDVSPAFNRLFDEVIGYVVQQGGQMAGAPFDRWLDAESLCDGTPPAGLRVEACAPLRGAVAPSDRVQVYEMEGEQTIAFHGPARPLHAYQAGSRSRHSLGRGERPPHLRPQPRGLPAIRAGRRPEQLRHRGPVPCDQRLMRTSKALSGRPAGLCRRAFRPRALARGLFTRPQQERYGSGTGTIAIW